MGATGGTLGNALSARGTRPRANPSHHITGGNGAVVCRIAHQSPSRNVARRDDGRSPRGDESAAGTASKTLRELEWLVGRSAQNTALAGIRSHWPSTGRRADKPANGVALPEGPAHLLGTAEQFEPHRAMRFK